MGCQQDQQQRFMLQPHTWPRQGFLLLLFCNPFLKPRLGFQLLLFYLIFKTQARVAGGQIQLVGPNTGQVLASRVSFFFVIIICYFVVCKKLGRFLVLFVRQAVWVSFVILLLASRLSFFCYYDFSSTSISPSTSTVSSPPVSRPVQPQCNHCNRIFTDQAHLRTHVQAGFFCYYFVIGKQGEFLLLSFVIGLEHICRRCTAAHKISGWNETKRFPAAARAVTPCSAGSLTEWSTSRPSTMDTSASTSSPSANTVARSLHEMLPWTNTYPWRIWRRQNWRQRLKLKRKNMVFEVLNQIELFCKFARIHWN